MERDLASAEEYYGRALLACPGDADLLSLYGRVLLEANRERTAPPDTSSASSKASLTTVMYWDST